MPLTPSRLAIYGKFMHKKVVITLSDGRQRIGKLISFNEQNEIDILDTCYGPERVDCIITLYGDGITSIGVYGDPDNKRVTF